MNMTPAWECPHRKRNHGSPCRPAAVAHLAGGPLAPGIDGVVSFYDVPGGTWVCAEIDGLPPSRQAAQGSPPVGPYGFHLHEFGSCVVGDPADPFQAAGGHWNPTGAPHPGHAGDFPVLFADGGGRALACFYTDRFKSREIVGRAVIVHQNPDDYRTQPAGASGLRLACGVVERV